MSRIASQSGRYSLLLVAVIVTTASLPGCKELDLDTAWTAGPIKIDGVSTEWADLETTYFDEDRLLIGLSNDGENLYLLIRFGDPAWIQTMRMGSLTVWLDKDGKKRTEFGIRYFGGPEPGRIADRTPSGETRITPTRLTVIAGDPDGEISIPTDGSKGPAAAFRITSAIYTCEMSIPFLDGSDAKYGIDVEPGHSVMIGLNLKVDREQLLQGMQRGAPGMGRGGGGMMGGMPRGRPGMAQEHKIWINTVLAVPPR